MQVRVFESTDMASGLKMVRKELGPDALILSTRTVRNGKLGLLGKPTIEITAAIDTNWPKEDEISKQVNPAPQESPPPRLFSRSATRRKRIDTTVGDDDIMLDYTSANKPPESDLKNAHQILTSAAETGSTPDAALRSEVDELKELVQQLAIQLTVAPKDSDVKKQDQSLINAALKSRHRIQPPNDPITELLHRQGVDSEAAKIIGGVVREQFNKEYLTDKGKIRRYILRAIESLIDVKPPQFRKKQEKQKRIALIGPTGVGKTTTLAKLAAHYLGNYSNSIALITIDTYRIAAVEQLKVYGEIMHLPVDVVITPEQLEKAIKKHADKSLILIDTAGRSPRDSLCIEELTSFLRPHLDIEKHLVLSAATREQELLDIIRHFTAVGIDRTIFTKIDECMRTGVILNVQLQHRAPLSYITNGQRVPEDLLQITRRAVAELIMSHHEGITHD